MMAKYRKKPVVIEAVQFTREMAERCLIDKEPAPFRLTVSGQFNAGQRKVHSAYIYIKTMEGVMRADIGDYIIRGVKGELYPCKPDIFEATYEPVH